MELRESQRSPRGCGARSPMYWIGATVFLAACPAQERAEPVLRPVPARPPSPAPVAPQPAVAAPARPERAGPELTTKGLERPPAVLAQPIEVAAPAADAVIPRALLSESELRVVSAPPPGASWHAALDDFRPRALERRSIALELLIPAGHRLGSGEHRLVVFAVDQASGTAIAPNAGLVRWWWLEERQARRRSGPVLILNQPRGTYNGERAAEAILIDPVIVGEFSLQPLVEVQGAAYASRRGLEPFLLLDAPSGDYVVSASVRSQQGPPIRVERRIVVNRDAPLE